MVGVPGRSRACAPCKTRRVACGQEQPVCSRCVKAERKCEYPSAHIFVLSDEGSHKTKYRKPGQARSPSKDPEQKSNFEAPVIKSQRQTDPVEVDQSLSLFKAPFTGRLLQQALLARAVSEGHFRKPTTFSGIISRSIVNGVFEKLHAPPLACYTLWRGRRDCNSSLIEASRQLYVRGLVETQKTLMDPSLASSDIALASCNALGLYEALEAPDKNGIAYRWHRAACTELIRIRGPEAHRDGVAHQLFLSIRLFAILEAFENARTTFLAREDWMTVPWQHHPKSSFDKLVDIFTLGPAVLQRSKRLEYLPPNELFPAAIAIVTDLGDVDDKLHKFFNELEKSYDGRPLYWTQNSPKGIYGAHACDIDHGFCNLEMPISWFVDPDIASILSMFWAILALIWSGLADLYSLFEQLGATEVFTKALNRPGPNDRECLRSKYLEYCRNILQSVTYSTNPEALEFGPPRISTALNIVFDILKNRNDCAEERAWAVKAKNSIGERWVKLLSYHL